MPPAPGCVCGWYADVDVEDLIARARGFPKAAQLASGLGVVDPSWTYLVVGKVELHDVVPYRPPATLTISPRAEYRARLGGIIELGILDTDGGTEAEAFARELAERYDVDVQI
jgi:hypothetical protein